MDCICNNGTISGGLEKALHISSILFYFYSALAFLGVVMATSFLIFNVKYRRFKIIKMSSPNINILTSIGAIMCYAAAVMFGVDVDLSHSLSLLTRICQARLWLSATAFTLVFGAIFSKQWRVHRIFTQANLKRTVIRDEKLLLMISVMLLMDVIILSLWQSLDPLRCRIIALSSEVETLECSSHYIGVWLAVTYVYKGGLLLFGVYLSWTTRQVLVPSMNDSRANIVCINTFLILVALVTGLTPLLQSEPTAWYGCVGGAILFCTSQVLLFQNVPRIIDWRKELSLETCRTPQISYITNRTENSEEDFYMIQVENEGLKKSNQQKDLAIKELQQLLEKAQKQLMEIMVEDSGFDGDLSSSSQQDECEAAPRLRYTNSTPAAGAKRSGGGHHHKRRRPRLTRRSLSFLRRSPKLPGGAEHNRSLREPNGEDPPQGYGSRAFQKRRNSIASVLSEAQSLASNLEEINRRAPVGPAYSHPLVLDHGMIELSVRNTFDLSDNESICTFDPPQYLAPPSRTSSVRSAGSRGLEVDSETSRWRWPFQGGGRGQGGRGPSFSRKHRYMVPPQEPAMVTAQAENLQPLAHSNVAETRQLNCTAKNNAANARQLRPAVENNTADGRHIRPTAEPSAVETRQFRPTAETNVAEPRQLRPAVLGHESETRPFRPTTETNVAETRLLSPTVSNISTKRKNDTYV